MADTRGTPLRTAPVNAPAAAWQAGKAAEPAEFEAALAAPNTHSAEMNLPLALEEDGAA